MKKWIPMLIVIVLCLAIGRYMSSNSVRTDVAGTNRTNSVTTEQPTASNEPTITARPRSTPKPTTTPKPTATPRPTEEPKAEAVITYESFRLYSDSIGSVWGQAIVEITNIGSLDIRIPPGSYDVEDEGGKLVATQSLVSVFPNVIAPGEKAYMYEETIFSDLDPSSHYIIVPHLKGGEAKTEPIRYDVVEFELKANPYGLGLEGIGRIENNTDSSTSSMIYVAVALYDAEKNCIGHMFTILMDSIAPGEKMGFEINGMSLPRDVTIDAVKSWEIIAYPYQIAF